MLIGARDEDGITLVFATDKPDAITIDRNGKWHSMGAGCIILQGDEAEPFCQNIPPGENRVIDLEKSTIVHVQPKKTAVEELVEACEGAMKVLQFGVHYHAIESALARVRQEGGK